MSLPWRKQKRDLADHDDECHRDRLGDELKHVPLPVMCPHRIIRHLLF